MTLTQAATWTKRGIALFAITFILGIVAIIGYNVWYRYYLTTLPKPEVKPEMKFGSLPELKFPPMTVSSSNFSYAIETETGDLPKFPNMIKVYFVPPVPLSLMASEKTKRLAESFGFLNEAANTAQNRQRFTDNEGGELTVDLTTGNFRLQKQSTTSAKQNESPPGKDTLIGEFKSHLGARELLPEILQNGRADTSPVIASSSATLDEVSLWPSDIDELPVVSAPLQKGLVRGIPAYDPEGKIFFDRVDYTLWQIDNTTFSTYPLITAEQALIDLKTGKGFISSDPKTPKVSVASVRLAYYEAEEYAPYLQPVFIFEGPGFAALVPAIAK